MRHNQVARLRSQLVEAEEQLEGAHETELQLRDRLVQVGPQCLQHGRW
jgi:hypothetical protein